MKKIFAFLLTVSVFCSCSAFSQTEFGTASFYGIEFNGRPTASGEIYSQNKLTAAHKTLPLGTIVKVTNAQNNKSVFVKVNDRGPYVKGRVIDLSTKAAELLGYRNKGTAYVKIEIVKPDSIPTDLFASSVDIARQNGIQQYDSATTASTDSNKTSLKVMASITDSKTAAKQTEKPQPQPATEIKEANSSGITNRSAYFIITRLDKTKSGFYGLQLGIFSDMNIIFAIIEELEAKYNQPLLVEQEDLNGKTVYKLCIGKYQNRAYADALKLVLSDKYKDTFVVKYE